MSGEPRSTPGSGAPGATAAEGDDLRRRREATFHDRWADEIDPATTLVDETFTSVTAVENRFILEELGELRGKRVLDYGCGCAEGGVYLAKQGARVVAVDVSEGMLRAARRLAAHHGVEIETRLVSGAVIPADDNEFDAVYGNSVLHHVDLDVAIPELARVLDRSGRGCFVEPLPYNPIINVYRRMADRVRTVDERPLTFGDIDRFRTCFREVRHREFWLTTLAVFLRFFLIDRVHPNRERYWKKIYRDATQLAPLFTPLKRLDDLLLARLPFLRRLCWVSVITACEPRKEPRGQP